VTHARGGGRLAAHAETGGRTSDARWSRMHLRRKTGGASWKRLAAVTVIFGSLDPEVAGDENF
jgi:hypothetical protein